MSNSTDWVYLSGEALIITVTLVTVIYMYRRLRHDRWYLLHALPMLIYSAHVLVYYAAVMGRRWLGVDFGFPIMAWSLALRLHGALMVAMMARTVVLCKQSC